MIIDELSLEEKIGQMLMIGLKDKNNEQIEKLIKENKIGGVILYKNNYNNYENMKQFVNNIKSLNKENKIPIFISIDQEGGRVNRIPPDVLNIKSATKLAETKNVETIKESGKIIGKMLNKTGISIDYAPILDIRRFEEFHPIGDRCYGQNKQEVAKYAIEFMKELQLQKVISVIKHFPGHGLTKKDSHFRIPKIKEKINVLENEDMYHFKVAIENGSDAIMLGHLIIKDIDKRYPASLSKKIIQQYLIKKYNYKGLIITDDFKMMAIRVHYNIKKAVKLAINAGNDIIMLGFSSEKINEIIKYIVKQVKKGKILEEDINDSVKKIIEMKEKYKITDEKISCFDIEEINYKISNLNSKVI